MIVGNPYLAMSPQALVPLSLHDGKCLWAEAVVIETKLLQSNRLKEGNKAGCPLICNGVEAQGQFWQEAVVDQGIGEVLGSCAPNDLARQI